MEYNLPLRNAIKIKFGSQIRLATKYGLDPTLLSKWVNGWREPDAEQKKLLAEALELPEDQLFGNNHR